MSYLTLLILSKLLMFPLISLTLIHHYWSCFLPCNFDAHSCSILPPVSSAHFSILFYLPTECINSPSPSSPHKVWLYHISLTLNMLMLILLCSIDWRELLLLSDPNASWAIFKEVFLSIMSTTVRNKLVYPPYQLFFSLGQPLFY